MEALKLPLKLWDGRGVLSWGGGGVGGRVGGRSEGHGPTRVGAKFFETSFPHFMIYFTQIGPCYL